MIVGLKKRIAIKPQSPTINWLHPLANGLTWFALPGADQRQEIISRGSPTFLSSANYSEQSVLGSALKSTSTTNGGIAYPWTNKLLEITNQFTIVVWCRIDAVTAFSHLLTIPYSSTWSSPFYSIQFVKDNATSNMAIAWTVAGSGNTALGTTNGFVTTGNMACFAVTVNAAGVARFFKNGVFGETATRGSSGGNIDWGSKREVTLLNHNSADPGEGITGVCPYAAIWNRTLSDTEIQQLYYAPFDFLSAGKNLRGTSKGVLSATSIFPVISKLI